MVTLLERKAEWLHPEHWDEGEGTEEQAMEMVVFCAITDFLQQKEDELLGLLSQPENEGIDTDLGNLVSHWLDGYSGKGL
jgi:hypothetical protein